jgi:uncharacterized protein (UPF0147 family)
MVTGNSPWTEEVVSGNWNSAKLYADTKIMKHLIELDTLLEVAKFGTIDILEDFILDENTKTKARIQALRRFSNKLYMVLSNTRFALKSDKAKESFDVYLKIIERVEENFLGKGVVYTETKSINKVLSTKINENNFKKVLDILKQVKMDLLEPLNKAELIFRNYENEDPDIIKKRIMEDIISSG